MSCLVIAAGIVLGAVAAMFVLKSSTAEAAAPAGSDAAVRAAVAKLPGYVRQVMKKTGVPGAAVAVVHKNKLIYDLNKTNFLYNNYPMPYTLFLPDLLIDSLREFDFEN